MKMDQLGKTFIKLIGLMVGLLALITSLVGVIGLVIYLSYAGVKLPEFGTGDEQILATE